MKTIYAVSKFDNDSKRHSLIGVFEKRENAIAVLLEAAFSGRVWVCVDHQDVTDATEELE